MTDPPELPYAAKGVGKLGVTAKGSAIADRFYGAIGVQIESLLITLRKILSVLKGWNWFSFTGK